MKEYNGIDHLKKTLSGEYPNPSTLAFDDEAEFITTLPELEYINALDFDQDIFENQIRMRSKIRYLAALFPKENIIQLTHRIHALINNKNMDTDSLRLILQGKSQADPSRTTHEIRINIIQGIGKCLREGLTLRATAREMQVSLDTVIAIEAYLGIRKAFKLKMVDVAVDAAREDWSVRKLAKTLNCSRTLATKLLNRGNQILTELGEK